MGVSRVDLALTLGDFARKSTRSLRLEPETVMQCIARPSCLAPLGGTV
tara:strand:- start:619 stop:762 length:144 start_codon:yes stop_codon:yes gene_type:complete